MSVYLFINYIQTWDFDQVDQNMIFRNSEINRGDCGYNFHNLCLGMPSGRGIRPLRPPNLAESTDGHGLRRERGKISFLLSDTVFCIELEFGE